MTDVDKEINSILDGIGDPIFILDKNMVILRVNKASCDVFQRKPEEMVGKHCYEIVHGDDHPFPTCPAVKTLKTKQVITGEIEDYGLNVPLLVTTCPTFDASGEVKQITHMAKDISKLRATYRRIEVMNEKLRVLGRLTRHDVRNKLSTVTGYSYILKKKYGDKADVADALQSMEQAVAQSTEIFDFAKVYEQLGTEDLSYVDVEAKINEACALFSDPLPTMMNECKGLTVLADSFLRQLFYNFIHNTMKYGKKTTIIKILYQLNPENLQLIYEDDGVGIPAENKSHLFKEGFSTGGSTGYGLFLIKKMMDIYGWQIEENGEPGQGAKFVITVPYVNKIGQVNYQIQK